MLYFPKVFSKIDDNMFEEIFKFTFYKQERKFIMRPNTDHALPREPWGCTITANPTKPPEVLPGDTIQESKGKIVADFLKDVDVSKFRKE